LIEGRDPGGLLGGERLIVVALRFRDLRAEFAGLFFCGLIIRGQRRIFVRHLQDKRVRLRPLRFHRLPLAGEIGFCAFKFELLRFKLGTLRLDFCCHVGNFLQNELVGFCNLVNHIHAAQQIGKASGLKEDRPIRNLPGLLHGAQANLIPHIHSPFFLHGLVKFVLLLRNQQAVLLNLLTEIFSLFPAHFQLLVNVGLLFHERLRL
jgi:hypothetical protein